MAPVWSQKTEGELRRIAESEGCELLEVELKGGVLRFFIDHPDGVTLEHCESFSKQTSALLDLEDFGLGSYVLEVSSPGLDRKLYGARDYRRFTGRLVRVTFRVPETGRRRTIVGTLEAFSEAGGGRLSLRDREQGEALELPLEQVALARLEIDL
ncbi:MAG TPA: ribosome maturation factor RimP [Thermoanaerobaculia bacterium]|nr:ribosome maturation factor RimP [Thermoanaerobaculia bacterium]